MEIRQIQEDIQRCSTETERIYTRMGAAFPSLLSITRENNSSSSLPLLLSLFNNLSEGFSGYRRDEADFFEAYNRKNESLFATLNEKMAALDRVNERVSAIRTDSEELEIISLNAMVISIKSGEKGRAFSCITETLKRLSASMISLSNSLMIDEKKLVDRNEALKGSFNAVLGAQRDVINANDAGKNADIVPVIAEASTALDGMGSRAREVSAPIQEAMSGVQLQDIIRQSIDQILLALAEIHPQRVEGSSEEKLDQLTLDIELLDICLKIATDIRANLDASIADFAENWKKVHAILDDVERRRVGFVAEYLDSANRSGKSLTVILDGMTSGFSDYISRINLYQRGQRTMVRDSTMIVSEVKHLRALFDTIRPIIARLQHVRITQQIEVAKNPAISAVKDTVEHMSELIMQADVRVQDTRRELEEFIAEIEALTGDFTSGAEKDNRDIDAIKQEKTRFFNRMKEYQVELASAVVSLQVYPDSFQSLCAEIDRLLGDLEAIRHSMAGIAAALEEGLAAFRGQRDGLLSEAGLRSWDLHNGRFRELVERFTITSHKQAAGKIGGFDVEASALDTIESGDVTLFF